jgi:HAD superfamily hydrolase (TIGR01490 family)
LFVSAFDLDCTLLKKNSSFEFCKYLYKNNVLSSFSMLYACVYYIWHTCFGLSLERLHSKVFESFLQGLSMEMLSRQVTSFVNLTWKDLVYFPAWERLKSAQHKGHFTLILSSSPSFLVRVLAEKFQVDDWKASEYLVDAEQKLSCVDSILLGNGKALALQRTCASLHIPTTQSIAYSDSILDLCFLQAAGLAVVVNPDSHLQKLSSSLSWEQI